MSSTPETITALRRMFLDETIEHFNSTNRGMSERITRDGTTLLTCSYMGGCAIGRHIQDKTICAKLDMLGDDSGCGDNPIVFEMLPDNLKDLGESFLSDMQTLHDFEFHWDSTGLTGLGKECAKRIRDAYSL